MKTKILYGIILASLLAISAIGGYRYGVRKSIEGGALALLINDDAFKAETQKKILESYKDLELEKLGRSVVCRTDTVYLPAPCGEYSEGKEVKKYHQEERKLKVKSEQARIKADKQGLKNLGMVALLCSEKLKNAKTETEKNKICLGENQKCKTALEAVGDNCK